MALNRQDTKRVAAAIEMLTRVLMAENSQVETASLHKSRDLIDNLLKQGREKKEG